MLDVFAAAKVEEVAFLKANFDADLVKPREKIKLANILRKPEGISIIAEIKRASPSRGELGKHIDPLATARSYAESGAAMISVVTDKYFFGAEPEILQMVRGAVDIPVLRKDFIIDPVQIYESAYNGADMVLLIAALHNYDSLLLLCEKCRELGVEPLLETHTQTEVEMVVDLPVNCIGVNNRNLQNFAVDLNTSFELARYIPDQFVRISESGISNPSDLLMLKEYGYQAALVGEALLTSANPGKKLCELLAGRGGQEDD